LEGEHGKNSFLFAIGAASEDPEDEIPPEDRMTSAHLFLELFFSLPFFFPPVFLSQFVEDIADIFAFQRYQLVRYLGRSAPESEAIQELLLQQIRTELQEVCFVFLVIYLISMLFLC
jgi:hypothetical protein